MKDKKKIIISLISSFFLLTSCSTINETISTGYESLLDSKDSIKESITSNYNKAKTAINKN